MQRTLRASLVVALAAVLVVALSVPALAVSAPMLSAKGSVGFAFGDGSATASFQVKQTGPQASGEEHAPARGTFSLMADDGTRFLAKIEHIHAHAADEVHFHGQIVKSADSALVGQFVHVAVVDGGTPGVNGDMIAVVVSPTEEHDHGTLVPVTSGNLVVLP